MLNSLEIQNYRNFKHLTIEKLGRVNLIIGKNNTGKSSLLEAVSLYLAGDKSTILKRILKQRDEYSDNRYSKISSQEGFLRENLQMLSSIFYGRKLDESRAICIRADNGTTFCLKINSLNNTPCLEIVSNETGIINLDSNLFSHAIFLSNVLKNRGAFLSSDNFIYDNTEKWGKIALTDKEKYVIQALNIIDSAIQRFNYVLENNEQKPKVSLQNGEVVNLRSMGVGINRILNIILSLINCEDKTLLIDEFDNGLHHSVQEKLWEIVFYLANKLNIQVFATTHSYDCMRAFQEIANKEDRNKDAMLIKLVNKKAGVVAITTDGEESKEVVELGIDIR